MASLFRPLLRPQSLGLGLGLSVATLHLSQQCPMRLDSGPMSIDSHRRNEAMPAVQNGRLDLRSVRQISSGSIIGLCAGLVVSTFSRSLVLLLGSLAVGIQWASSYGINVIPYHRLQKYVTSINLQSAVQDNVAFKLSVGMAFALAAFMEF